MKIRSADFVKSSTKESECPNPDKPEYAFIGRSNVGKSSLINLITGRKRLAKTSSTPGKTQWINHFLINDEWYLVDLPGYGYAKAGKKERSEWQRMAMNYLRIRSSLSSVFVLIDSRHRPQKIDIDFIHWVGKEEIPFVLVFTKLDKLAKSQNPSNIAQYKKELLKTWEALPQIFTTSVASRTGKEEILDYIRDVNQSIHR